MIDVARKIIIEEHCTLHEHLQVPFVTVSDSTRGIELAKKILYEIVDRRAVLYLSGGKTPQEMYRELAREEQIAPGVAALVDERYGKPFHENSNELMLRETGFLRYLQMKDIPFFGILSSRHSRLDRESDSRFRGNDDTLRKKLTEDYDQRLRELFATYQKHIAILGIGLDGHTAGIPSDRGVWEEFGLKNRMKIEMAIDYDDHGKFYGERISMSFLALSMMDVFLVLVFGQDKRRALEWMFADGLEDEVPSRFFKRPDIAPKTLIITDQRF
jgi:6-phosphogluconolactonase/glucosamine-6-phosphate isomerase/deaminase